MSDDTVLTKSDSLARGQAGGVTLTSYFPEVISALEIALMMDAQPEDFADVVQRDLIGVRFRKCSAFRPTLGDAYRTALQFGAQNGKILLATDAEALLADPGELSRSTWNNITLTSFHPLALDWIDLALLRDEQPGFPEVTKRDMIGVRQGKMSAFRNTLADAYRLILQLSNPKDIVLETDPKVILAGKGGEVSKSEHGKLTLTSFYPMALDWIDLAVMVGEVPHNLPLVEERDLIAIRIGDHASFRGNLQDAYASFKSMQVAIAKMSEGEQVADDTNGKENAA